MAFINVTQMIEKERQTVVPENFWRCEREKQIKDKCDESLVFNNCLTETASIISYGDQVSDKRNENTDKDKGIKHDNKLMKDLEEDSDNIGRGANISGDDLDTADYFDSEDEYWDSLINKDIKEELCPNCRTYHLPKSIKDIPLHIHIKEELCPNCRSYHLPKSIKDVPLHIRHNQEVYDTSPAFIPAVQKFAKENSFEIHDVYGDKNCLFRAVADQFMINGCPGHTEISLRDTAIDRLRLNPSRYGVNKLTFLPGESWEEYIQKMNQTKKWGVYTILQALADVFLLQISIFHFVNSDITPSKITIKSTEKVVPKLFHIFLGLVGDFHTFSLRPLQWMAELPYKAQIFRMLVTCTDKNIDERRTLVDRKLALISQGHIPKSQLAEHVQFVLQCISLENRGRHGQLFEKTNFESIFKSYSGSDLELEESIEIRNKLVGNHLQFDPLSGIPLPYLSVVIKLIFQFKLFEGEYSRHPQTSTGDIDFHFLGSFMDQSSFTLKDISRTKKMSKLQVARRAKFQPRAVVVIRNKEAVYNADLNRTCTNHEHVIIDSINSHPGYCKLRLSPSFSSKTEDNVSQIGKTRYLKAFRITDGLRTQLKAVHVRKVECIGVPCYTFPFFRRWEESKIDNFPSREVITSIVEQGCTLIPKAHPKSICQDIEWQFNFSMGEHLLFKSLTVAQKHGFFVLKVLLVSMVHHVPFKTKHLKSVFLMACEKLPSGSWETNISGCVLYVLGLLLSCLRAKFLPNYFIPENNLIDCHRDEDINTLCVVVEYIRLFPASVIQIVAEKHGYTFGPNLIKIVLSKIRYFTERHMHRAFDEIFGPFSIATAKIMAKIGLYDISFDILQELFEQSLLIPQTGLRQTSLSFFDLFVSALMEMKQKTSRVILARTFDMMMGSNVSEMVLEKERRGSLQTYLPWIADNRIGWIEVSNESSGDLTKIASFLYDFSKREYWRQNALLAELSITTAIQCIQEALKQDDIEGDNVKNIGSKTDVNVRKRMLKRKLISFYMHVYRISALNNFVYPLIDHMDEIEELCLEFPEMTGTVCFMFSFMGQQSKYQEYFQKYYHMYGHELRIISPESFDTKE